MAKLPMLIETRIFGRLSFLSLDCWLMLMVSEVDLFQHCSYVPITPLMTVALNDWQNTFQN
jgi:hypothetical protein